MSTRLQTVGEVIDALGGTDAVKALTGAKWEQSVSGWRTNNRFPAKTHKLLTTLLEAAGFTAPDSLWGQIDRADLPKQEAVDASH